MDTLKDKLVYKDHRKKEGNQKTYNHYNTLRKEMDNMVTDWSLTDLKNRTELGTTSGDEVRVGELWRNRDHHTYL